MQKTNLFILTLALACITTMSHAEVSSYQQEPVQIDSTDHPGLHWVDKKADDVVRQFGKGSTVSMGRSYHILRHPIAALNRVASRAVWKKTYINLLKILAAAIPLILTSPISVPVLSATSIYDNTLSSAQLRTKGAIRRFAGWVMRHRVEPIAGPDRGSVQNTEMLLDEYANLPKDTSEKLLTIYREELRDMLERWEVGSEDANPELQARVEAALAA